MIDYLRDGPAIYEQSFKTIRAESDLSGLDPIASRTVVRMIHACGMVDLTEDIEVSPGFGAAAESALQAGAPVLCDTSMVAAGITRSRLPAGNEIICTLPDRRVPDLARELRTTRTAAAMELWRETLKGSLAVIGNAPTALFRLLEMIDEGADLPAAIVGVPVGFVGAIESKVALAEHASAPEFLVVHGRRGGSAMAVAAVNALGTRKE
ncbi:MAG: precorrin-8X methylmutase [Solirubrobacterales bacterium]